MGFMGIGYIGDSENAFDNAYDCANAFGAKLLKIVNKKDNCYNTPGYIDVALIIKDMCSNNSYFKYSETIKKASTMALAKLQNSIKAGEWDTMKKDVDALEKALVKFLKED